jgi:23S rRNA pseudouridine1911/1915/1917 synthase
MSPEILFEDNDILAVNKPAGLVVHSDGKTSEPTLVDWIIEKFPEARDVGEPWRGQNGEEILRSGIVHRLDRDTSGVMLVAKTQKGFECLKKQFQNRTIKKEYEAFVWGFVKNDKGTIDRPIGRSRSDFRKWSAQRGARGEMREAVTDYEVVFRFEKGGGKYTLVRAFPHTGRTHQIRVHLKAINYPIVGDYLYGPKKENALGFSRPALHARAITFLDIADREHTVEAPYQQDFRVAREESAICKL